MRHGATFIVACGLLLVTLFPARSAGQTAAALDDSFAVPGSPEMVAELAGWPSKYIPRVRVMREVLRQLCLRGDTAMADALPLRTTFALLSRVDEGIRKLKLEGPVRLRADDRDRRRAWTNLFELLGYDLSFPGSSWKATAIPGREAESLRTQLRLAGFRTPEMIAAFQRGEAVPLRVPSFEAPLPLGLAGWRLITGKNLTESQVLDRLLEDRNAALLYIGFTGLDDETARFALSHPTLLADMTDNPITLAEFSRSLRVRNGKVVLPLGLEAEPLWEAVAGTPTKDPERFLSRIMASDGGRLAWFLDGVTLAPPATQRFIMGTWLPAAERVREAQHTYSVFRGSEADTRILKMPFHRLGPDLFMLLRGVALNPDGAPQGPASIEFLSRAFATTDLGNDGKNLILASPAGAQKMTAGRLLNVLADAPLRNTDARAHVFFQAQRLLAANTATTGPELGFIMRGSMRFPALADTLEQLAASPALVSAAIRRAEYFRKLQNPPALLSGLLQLQGCLSLIQSSVKSGGLEAATGRKLALSLVETAPAQDGFYRGRLLEWLDKAFLPAARLEVDDGAQTAEDVVRFAISGKSRVRTKSAFEWQGWNYAIDVPDFRAGLTRAARSAQKSAPIDAVIELEQTTAALAQATTLDQFNAAAARLEPLATRLSVLVPPPDPAAPVFDAAAIWRDTLKDMKLIKSVKNLPRVKQQQDQLEQLTDFVAASVLVSWVYATHLHLTDTPTVVEGLPNRHDLGAARKITPEREAIAWAIPIAVRGFLVLRDCPGGDPLIVCSIATQPVPGVDYHMEGSLLELDRVVGPLSLSSTVAEGVPMMNHLTVEDLQAFANTADLIGPRDDQTAREAAAAIVRGRAALAAGASFDDIRPDWRLNFAIPWARKHEPETVPFLVMPSELLMLGGAGPDLIRVWGGSGRSVSGCACLAAGAAADTENLSLRPTEGHLGLLGAELRLRLAELMAGESVPPVLSPVLFEMAAAAVADSPMAGNSRDWWPVVVASERISPNHLDDYLAILTRIGLLKLAAPTKQ